jgi:hypothetical protein
MRGGDLTGVQDARLDVVLIDPDLDPLPTNRGSRE